MDRNNFKSPFTGEDSGQVGLRICGQRDYLEWYAKKDVMGPNNKSIVQRIDPESNWRMEVCLELRHRIGEQSLELFFIGLVAGKKVPEGGVPSPAVT